MRFILLFLYLSSSFYANANDLSGTFEIGFQHSHAIARHGHFQDWATQQTTRSIIDSNLQLNSGSFHSELRWQDDQINLNSLYLDIESEHADWTVGRKPHQWSFAMTDSQLNWLDQQWLLMREQYLGTGSWQLYCSHLKENSSCGSRVSGWFNLTDWQLMLSFDKTLKAAAAVQQGVGNSGLVFTEVFYQANKQSGDLEKIAPNLYQTQMSNQPFVQVNLGSNWTSRLQTEIHIEALFNNAGLNKDQWQQAYRQLQTDAAGLVAASFNQPLGRQQYLLRASQKLNQFSIANNWLYWPDVNKTWLNEFKISKQLGDNFDIGVAWKTTKRNGVLSAIGMDDELSVSIQFKDGF